MVIRQLHHSNVQKHICGLKCTTPSFHLCSCLCILPILTGLTDHEIVSQVTVFMFGGFETSASTLAFLAYNLARNPEVMARLQKEIDSTFPNKVEQTFLVLELLCPFETFQNLFFSTTLQGPVQYEALMQMEYLDSVVNESLR